MPFELIDADPTTGDVVINSTIRLSGAFTAGLWKALGIDPLDISVNLDEVLEGVLHSVLGQGLVNLAISAIVQNNPNLAPKTQEEVVRLAENIGFSADALDRKSTRLNSSHITISYA